MPKVAAQAPKVQHTPISATVTMGRKILPAVQNMTQAATAAMAEVRNNGDKSTDLVKIYAILRTLHEGIEDALKEFGKLVTMLDEQLIPAAFEREAVQTITTNTKDRATVTPKLYASILAEKREAAFEWLRANGHASIITEVVNAGTLSAFARAEAKEGRELPEDKFTTHIKYGTTLTRGPDTKALFLVDDHAVQRLISST